MKANNHNFYQLLNSVRKTNDVKQYLWYAATNSVYHINRILRLLNY
ncbi:hypothetical protein SAMN05216490_0781 [Mucilaginibacter mallensis]|uniref:Uncharacterized protein n=1 Tax=Mucilaginibacter mallensis TaxID=652787 RepID=A0A1H1QI38_MUCMA|nr:hypothetical protein SAMN05216490_0781 [Mucilaginibacter mallensis]